MDDLIKQLEEATEGNKELDFKIANRISLQEYDVYYDAEDWPEYTTSVDAALTLIPKDFTCLHAGQNSQSKTWYFGLHSDAQEGINDGFCRQTHSEDWPMSNHQTNSLPIAICISALKARKYENK